MNPNELVGTFRSFLALWLYGMAAVLILVGLIVWGRSLWQAWRAWHDVDDAPSLYRDPASWPLDYRERPSWLEGQHVSPRRGGWTGKDAA